MHYLLAISKELPTKILNYIYNFFKNRLQYEDIYKLNKRSMHVPERGKVWSTQRGSILLVSRKSSRVINLLTITAGRSYTNALRSIANGWCAR